MQYCLSLASRGVGYVSPNPMVGAVVVVGGRIIGEGWHREFGGAHAEVNALQDVKTEDLQLLPQATLFVTLEPCNHFGKTPPCTEKILTSGIKNVVIGTLDPNPLVAGKGVERLKANGVQVTVGVLENACRELNKFFFCYHEKNVRTLLLNGRRVQTDLLLRMMGHLFILPITKVIFLCIKCARNIWVF
ncbi:MAG: bifunctional diaminohydroxyphosphoribosylaminopyrimidine deaminase/5-amino-6-(5-phosphoribosylamino)uracil reductase RibD [Chitinophagales bacterium]